MYISEHKQTAHNDGNRAQPLKRLLHHRCYMGEHKTVQCY